MKFCSQDTILMLDYPLLIDIHSLIGVDAVHKYICAIKTEGLFLGKFDRNYVKSIHRMANPCYESMIENVCDIVQTNIIGHIKIVFQIYENDKEIFEYLCCDIKNIAVRIDIAARNKQLEKLFVL